MHKKTTPLLILFLALWLNACVKTSPDPNLPGELTLLASYPLDISDPSGLSRSHITGLLFCVSDDSGNLYLINTVGEIQETWPIYGHDPEGVIFVKQDSLVYILEEKLRWVISFNMDGMPVDTFRLDIPLQNLNDGPEGITFNPEKQQFYIVNEKNPGMLFVYTHNFVEKQRFLLDFALDYSALDYESETQNLWILSDESSLLARCNLQGELLESFITGAEKGEGLVADRAGNRIYIVCDATSQLHVYLYPLTK